MYLDSVSCIGDLITEVNDHESMIEDAQYELEEARELKVCIADEHRHLRELKEDVDYQNAKELIDTFGRHAELIPEDSWESYAEEYASNLTSEDLNDWPYCYIDWERATSALTSDFSTEYIGGNLFYVREG